MNGYVSTPRSFHGHILQRRCLSRRTSEFTTRSGREYRTIFGSPEPHQVSILELIGSDGKFLGSLSLSLVSLLCLGGDPRFFCPFFASSLTEDRDELPLMIYVPGIDGTGLGASHQLESLAQGFQLESFLIPFQDRTNFQGLLDQFCYYIRNEIASQTEHRMLYLFGESFGALLTLAAAYECREYVDRVILVNPATGFSSSFWSNFAPLLPAIPKNLYFLTSSLIAPLVVNPVDYLLKKSTSFQDPNAIIQSGLEMLGTLEFVTENVDEKLLTWRLEVVRQGLQHVESYLHKIPQRTLILAAEDDRLLPSVDEAFRLRTLMLRTFIKTLPGKSHAFMEDSSVNLLQILKDEGFYVTKRVFTSNGGIERSNSRPKLNNFGIAAPTELPPKREIEKLESLVSQVNTLASPVFFSTDSYGNIRQGLKFLPESRPLLLVGNHVIMGLDLNILVRQVLIEKGILLRGLAHPAVTGSQGNQLPNEDDFNFFTRILGQVFNPRDAHKLFTTFGAVPVSPTNFYKLLSQGERILLYPGGAKEALKKRDEKYRVFWPKRAEFVRMAAKFGATVVTVASVGIEDGVEQLLDSSEVLDTPAGKDLKRLSEIGPKARDGIAAQPDTEAVELAPAVVLPLKPKRIYFLFGKPVELNREDARDREKCDRIYNNLKVDLETNITYLLEQRQTDPYKDFEKRIFYEAINQKQAPTFTPRPML
eukprot:g1615.t1